MTRACQFQQCGHMLSLYSIVASAWCGAVRCGGVVEWPHSHTALLLLSLKEIVRRVGALFNFCAQSLCYCTAHPLPSPPCAPRLIVSSAFQACPSSVRHHAIHWSLALSGAACSTRSWASGGFVNSLRIPVFLLALWPQCQCHSLHVAFSALLRPQSQATN